MTNPIDDFDIDFLMEPIYLMTPWTDRLLEQGNPERPNYNTLDSNGFPIFLEAKMKIGV